MKTMNLTCTNSIDQIRTYWDNMFSLVHSNSVLKAQELDIMGKEHAPYELNTIGRRLRT